MQPAKLCRRRAGVIKRIMPFAVILVAPRRLPEYVAIGDQHATLAGSGENLILAERERGHIAPTSNGPTAIHGTMGLGTVFHHRDIAATGQFQDRHHVAGPTGQMHGNDCLRAKTQMRFDCFRCNRLAISVDIRGTQAAHHEQPHYWP